MCQMAHLGGLLQVVVGYLVEQVVDHVGANVVVNLVKDAIVTVDCGQAAPHVVPLLRSHVNTSGKPL